MLWRTVEAKLLSRAVDVFRSGRGLQTTIKMFGIHFASLTAYKAQLSHGTPSLAQAFRRAAQRIIGAPWMCLSMVVLESLDALGFGVCAPRLDEYLFVNMVRASAAERAAMLEGRGGSREPCSLKRHFWRPPCAKFGRLWLSTGGGRPWPRWRIDSRLW